MTIKKSLTDKRHIMIIVIIALFNFVFLGFEYLFDNLYGLYAEKESVVFAQNIVLGVSAIGFLLYGFLSEHISKKAYKICYLFYMIIFAIGTIGVSFFSNKIGILLCGCILFLILGQIGAMVCYYASTRLLSLKHLAKTVGFGYALGILFQFINNNFVRSNLVQSIVLVVGFFLIYVLIEKLAQMENGDTKDENLEIRSAQYTAISLIVVTALLTLIFSTLDNAVTMVHASGSFDIGQWPRLILAVSGIVAGFIYDIKEQRVMPFVMYAVSVLSVLCIIIIQLGGSFLAGLFVFYISAGFFVVFFMSAFMQFSYYSTKPKIWAGLGRAINNICAFLTMAISVSLLNKDTPMAILIVALVLFVLISIAMVAYFYFSSTHIVVADDEKIIEAQKKTNTIERFGLEYKLTLREQEVLLALAESNSQVQEIAKNLGISRAALYRHIASINEKTNTKNRKELIHLYFEKSLE